MGRRGRASSSSTGRSRASRSSSGVVAGRRRRRPGGRADRAGVRRLRGARSRRAAASTSTTSSCGADRAARGRSGAARALAERCAHLLVDEVQDVDRAQLRLALLLAAPGEPDLPRRRRRPVDLRLAARRRAAGPGPRRARCRACDGSTSRSTTAARRRGRAGGPARRAQRGAVREADPAGPGGGRAGSSWRPMPPTSRSGSSGRCATWPRRRLDAGRPGPDEPRADPGRRGRARLPASRSVPPRLALPLEDPALDDAAGPRPADGTGRRTAARRASGADVPRPAADATPKAALATALLGLGAGVPATLDDVHGGRPSDARARLADAPPRRAAADPGDGPCDEGPRVRPRRRHRDGGGRFPSARAVDGAADPARALGGGATARLRRVDPGAALADAPLRPGGPSPFLLEAFTREELGLAAYDARA